MDHEMNQSVGSCAPHILPTRGANRTMGVAAWQVTAQLAFGATSGDSIRDQVSGVWSIACSSDRKPCRGATPSHLRWSRSRLRVSIVHLPTTPHHHHSTTTTTFHHPPCRRERVKRRGRRRTRSLGPKGGGSSEAPLRMPPSPSLRSGTKARWSRWTGRRWPQRRVAASRRCGAQPNRLNRSSGKRKRTPLRSVRRTCALLCLTVSIYRLCVTDSPAAPRCAWN
jgi:hypothetical protein